MVKASHTNVFALGIRVTYFYKAEMLDGALNFNREINMSNPQYKDIGSPETKVIEECSELIQALCKADRFGWFNFHPEHSGSTNLDDVRREMDDVLEAMNKLDIFLRELTYEKFKNKTVR